MTAKAAPHVGLDICLRPTPIDGLQLIQKSMIQQRVSRKKRKKRSHGDVPVPLISLKTGIVYFQEVHCYQVNPFTVGFLRDFELI